MKHKEADAIGWYTPENNLHIKKKVACRENWHAIVSIYEKNMLTNKHTGYNINI